MEKQANFMVETLCGPAAFPLYAGDGGVCGEVGAAAPHGSFLLRPVESMNEKMSVSLAETTIIPSVCWFGWTFGPVCPAD